MALIRRGNRSYWYRSVRKGGRVTSEYVAAGDRAVRLGAIAEESRQHLHALDLDYQAEAEAFRAEVARWKAEDCAAAEAWEVERQRMEAEDRAVAEWFDSIQIMADAAMVAAGYHRPKRTWRKRRG